MAKPCHRGTFPLPGRGCWDPDFPSLWCLSLFSFWPRPGTVPYRAGLKMMPGDACLVNGLPGSLHIQLGPGGRESRLCPPGGQGPGVGIHTGNPWLLPAPHPPLLTAEGLLPAHQHLDPSSPLAP